MIKHRKNSSKLIPHSIRCTVCLINYEAKDGCRRFDCGHVFHHKCIEDWLAGNIVKVILFENKLINFQSCPNCKIEIIPKKKGSNFFQIQMKRWNS